MAVKRSCGIREITPFVLEKNRPRHLCGARTCRRADTILPGNHMRTRAAAIKRSAIREIRGQLQLAPRVKLFRDPPIGPGAES